MIAIIETCGKQYSVEEGKTLFIEKMDANAGDKITRCVEPHSTTTQKRF